jgi:hypothetical protein
LFAADLPHRRKSYEKKRVPKFHCSIMSGFWYNKGVPRVTILRSVIFDIGWEATILAIGLKLW